MQWQKRKRQHEPHQLWVVTGAPEVEAEPAPYVTSIVLQTY